MKKILFAAVVLALGFTNASAQYGPRYDRGDYRDGYNREGMSEINRLQREARQNIANGVQWGTLTSREANMLMNRYENISDKERHFAHRGRLSNREERILRNDLHELMSDTRRLSRDRNRWSRDGRHRGRY
ncbi:hypothetical protein GCM10010967_16490 [Dyadobacter beijingensis]|uniref:Uncharacterized protein n=1 Tax=Dyadobacter beijingensis TaxID=365489 RepID=A0ABQ2HP72_9BACT|nr:hypothetical protein [Dyadobacter beijingensis]GGM85209.1 hypothetical protein GCM10010967_16490 [Dyadobacter beijingensis]